MYIYIYLYVYISYYRIDISAFLTPDQPREADNLNVKDRFLGTKTAWTNRLAIGKKEKKTGWAKCRFPELPSNI